MNKTLSKLSEAPPKQKRTLRPEEGLLGPQDARETLGIAL